jgi:hypothetical protein
MDRWRLQRRERLARGSLPWRFVIGPSIRIEGHRIADFSFLIELGELPGRDA